MKNATIPYRTDIPVSDKWNLSSLFKNDAEWEQNLADLAAHKKAILTYKKNFSHPVDITADTVLTCLKAVEKAEMTAEKAGNYAFLMKASDESDSHNTERFSRFMMAITEFNAATSWFLPALLKIPENILRKWIDPSEKTGAAFAPYKIFIEKQLRLKTHTLSEKEEKILSLLQETHSTQETAFSLLTNVDFQFGSIETSEGQKELTQSSYSQFLLNPDRNIRKTAYKQFYACFDAHKNTLAALYTGQIQQDIAHARIRGYASAREKSLYPDKVSHTVYDNLIQTVRNNLEPLHTFYALLKKTLGVSELHLYDVYMPLINGISWNTPYDAAVDIICAALQPLGNEYVAILRNGLLHGWVDRYENKGKQSGAFSSGGFEGEPFILMNYKEDVIRDVFTLAHEGGHSMHSWYSAQNNPFLSYNYTIFEAEVASTFNETLLFRYMMENTHDIKMKAYLLSMRISDIAATLYRQTMFAEYEHITHALVENGTPLTLETLRSEYRNLQHTYFGNMIHFEPESDLEGLRIPHFYHSFYVYKYATGISAALALAEKVCAGGKTERDEYFTFLKSGGSRYPIESLKAAGIDITQPAPIQAACRHFTSLLAELKTIITKFGSTVQGS